MYCRGVYMIKVQHSKVTKVLKVTQMSKVTKNSVKCVNCEIPKKIVSIVPSKEVALRGVVAQADIGNLNCQDCHLIL